MPSLGAKSNTNIDEVSLTNLKNSGVNGNRGRISTGIDGIREAGTEYEDYDVSIKENNLGEHPELEIDQSEITKIDEFTKLNPKKDRVLRDREEESGNRKRRQRRIGKKKRVNALGEVEEIDDYVEEEELSGFFSFFDQLVNRLSEIVEEVLDEFANWNNWFKKEKKAPPPPRKIKGAYVREEFNSKRNPHLWKSDPFKKWVLAFGASHGSNTVADILFKYQNDTISKDA